MPNFNDCRNECFGTMFRNCFRPKHPASAAIGPLSLVFLGRFHRVALIVAVLTFVHACLRYRQWPRFIRTMMGHTHVERKLTEVQAERQVKARQTFTRGRCRQQEDGKDPCADLEQEESGEYIVKFVVGIGRYLSWLMRVCVHTFACQYA